MRTWLLTFLLMFLVSCAPMAYRGQPTATPLSTPTATPTATPTPTVTPTPTPTPLPHPAAFDEAFTRRLIRYENGQWLVTAVQTADGGWQTVELVLLPDTFNANDELRAKNPLAPLTVRAFSPLPLGDPLTGAGGPGVREYTLLYHPDTAEFRVAPALPAIYEGVNTDHPTFNPEAFAQIPRFTIEDIQSGLAVQSLLVHIQDRLAAGESLSDILYLDPEAVRQNWQKLGGNSLLFKLLPDGKIAKLKAKGNDQGSATIRYDNLTMKLLPLGANIQINGEDHFAFYIANFDPIDRENPDPNNLANWKFFLSIPSYSGNPENPGDSSGVIWGNSFQMKKPLFPLVILYGDEKYQQNHPLLARLLGIEGNDAMKVSYMTQAIPMAENDYKWGEKNPVVELVFYGAIPEELQQMIFLFEVGVAR